MPIGRMSAAQRAAMLAKLEFERRLQRVAVHIIGRQKIPSRAEFFDQRVGDCVRLHRGRFAYAKHIPAALAAGDFVGVPAGHDVQLAFLGRHARHRQRYRRVDVAGDEIDLILVDQPPSLFDARHDLIGGIGNEQLRVTAENAAAVIDLIDGEPSAGDLRCGKLRKHPGERFDHANLYRLFFASPDRKRRSERAGGPRQARFDRGATPDQLCARRPPFLPRYELQVVVPYLTVAVIAAARSVMQSFLLSLTGSQKAEPFRPHLRSALLFWRMAQTYERLALWWIDPCLALALSRQRRLYAGFANARARQTGHLFQGRFGSVALDEDHLMNAARHVALNPAPAGSRRGRRNGRIRACAPSGPCATMGSSASSRSKTARRISLNLIEGEPDAAAFAVIRREPS